MCLIKSAFVVKWEFYKLRIQICQNCTQHKSAKTNLILQNVPLATEPGISGLLADRCSVLQQLGPLQTHTTENSPFHFSHNERTPVQISLQYLHWC